MISRNGLRERAVQISRSFKAVFRAGTKPGRVLTIVALVLAAIGVRRWAYRAAFTADGAALRLAAERVLADLRDFSFADASAFDRDPLIMARRQGRRDVWLRISNYLTLDEETVRKLMEIDDGI